MAHGVVDDSVNLSACGTRNQIMDLVELLTTVLRRHDA